MNINEVKQALALFRNSGAKITPLLIGQHGIGKTEVVKQFAKENHMPIRILQLGQMADAGDLIGLQRIIEEANKSQFTIPDWFPTEPNTLIFIDELNRANKELRQAIFQLVSPDRMYNGLKLPDGCLVVAAMNPDVKEYDTNTFEDSADQDRFCHLKVTSSPEAWLNYAATVHADNRLTAFISAYPQMLGATTVEFDVKVTPSPRSWDHVNRIMRYYDSAPRHIVTEVISGIVGLEATAAFDAFIKKRYTTIDVNQLLSDYSQVRDQVKALVNGEETRLDVINKTNEEILTRIRQKPITIAESDQLADYLADLPVSVTVNFYKSGLIPEQNFIIELLKLTDGKGCKITSDFLPKHFGDYTEAQVAQATPKSVKAKAKARKEKK